MDTFKRLQALLADNYPMPDQALSLDTPLAALEIDSLGLMELLFVIEDEFGIKVPNEPQDFQTVGDLVTYIERLVQGEAQASASVQTPPPAPSGAAHPGLGRSASP